MRATVSIFVPSSRPCAELEPRRTHWRLDLRAAEQALRLAALNNLTQPELDVSIFVPPSRPCAGKTPLSGGTRDLVSIFVPPSRPCAA